MVELSVIVPVYNVETYLERCVNSILIQSFKDFELILVDDGSTDNSGVLCDELAKRDKRIKVIHKKNGGVSSARNVGLDVAQGRYIGFVDSDDDILQGMYLDLINLLKVNEQDIIGCFANVVKNGKTRYSKCNDGKLCIYKYDKAIEYCIDNDEADVWSKLYKRELFSDIRFPEGRIYEDTIVTAKLFNKAKAVGFINKIYYNYYFNYASITKNAFNPKARYDFVLARKEVYDLAIEKDLVCKEKAKGLYIKSLLSCLTAIYASENLVENNKYLPLVTKQILQHRDYNSYKFLNPKYKMFLWCFGRLDVVHKVGAKLSAFHKKLR